jgi:flagellar protein FlaG
MAIKPVDPISSFDAVRAAVATAATTRSKSQRPPATSAPTQTQTREAAGKDPAKGPHVTEVKETAESQMRFHVDQDTGKTVIALVDPANGEVIRQFPTAEALEVAKQIGRFQGMFVNLKV